MFLTGYLVYTLNAAWPTASPVVLAAAVAVALVYVVIFTQVVIYRLGYLTTTAPTVPIGVVRKVACVTREDEFNGGRYRDGLWIAMSFFIVPYESGVIFVDSLVGSVDGKNEHEYCLTPQERVHSSVHLTYNMRMEKLAASVNRLNVPIMGFIKAFFRYSTGALSTVAPKIIHTIVVLHENKFYYDQTVGELFELFGATARRFPVMAKIYLWHFFEECEHHMEAVHFYRILFGWTMVVYIPLIMPIYAFLMYTTYSFGMLIALVNFEAKSLPQNIAHYLYDLVILDITIPWSAVLVCLGLASRDSKIKADLDEFRTRYQAQYDIDLMAENLRGKGGAKIQL